VTAGQEHLTKLGYLVLGRKAEPDEVVIDLEVEVVLRRKEADGLCVIDVRVLTAEPVVELVVWAVGLDLALWVGGEEVAEEEDLLLVRELFCGNERVIQEGVGLPALHV
jgi:hypothetical protein